MKEQSNQDIRELISNNGHTFGEVASLLNINERTLLSILSKELEYVDKRWLIKEVSKL
ncbi:hypothetical protein JSY36_12945 [Bacillus sp. H-16]|uniref:hypothetical protein n=1 Tax=Alteribacter salitolerans TaxID=2912333 RepID=UPI00196516F9|nr:hypothetical protein [Alteribacter salitolerans]MBM7096655.1 hypothetical protein [Alteribacter salitolerans]